MATVEHIKLLEAKIVKALDFAKRLAEENSQLKAELALSQKRVAELGEEESHIKEGILSTLDRLNQFEDALLKMGVISSKTDANEPVVSTY
jgi:hypothetical protein